MLKPEQITIIVDTREQTPLDFKIKDIQIPTEIATLRTGDYSCKGLEHKIAIERKSLPDLLGCIGNGRERFEHELQRMKAYETRALVIESSWREIEFGQYKRSKLHPNSVLGSLISWQERYSIPIMMVDNHARAGAFVARLIYSAVKQRYTEYFQFFSKETPKDK